MSFRERPLSGAESRSADQPESGGSIVVDLVRLDVGRWGPDVGSAGGQLVCDRIDARHIQRFFDAHLRQNAGHGTRQQGLTGSWTSSHKYIMDKKPYTFQ